MALYVLRTMIISTSLLLVHTLVCAGGGPGNPPSASGETVRRTPTYGEVVLAGRTVKDAVRRMMGARESQVDLRAEEGRIMVKIVELQAQLARLRAQRTDARLAQLTEGAAGAGEGGTTIGEILQACRKTAEQAVAVMPEEEILSQLHGFLAPAASQSDAADSASMSVPVLQTLSQVHRTTFMTDVLMLERVRELRNQYSTDAWRNLTNARRSLEHELRDLVARVNQIDGGALARATEQEHRRAVLLAQLATTSQPGNPASEAAYETDGSSVSSGMDPDNLSVRSDLAFR